ncbi:ABC transporter permease [Dictyobacter kobayashii]|uniref:Transport permease protein n=1 Tax=Dictyobacter kobayashii TaxID=2014872 RepID=A0A402AQW0_9CHLR|nr:ABC transporter permease [Dictyobacter kobayashii]GCE21481.1 transport permease protein [Dictyobacter kobayashii]
MKTNISSPELSQTQSPSPSSVHTDNDFRLAIAAFLAILHRDMVVTGHEFGKFLIQFLLQPLFYLFVFGTLLTGLGFANPTFSALLLPGIVALTIITTAFQGVTIPLILDLGFAHEIDDRLLAPLPVLLVGIEKIIFASIQGLVAGIIVFPCAFLMLGNNFHVRGDAIGLIALIMVLAAIAGASIGLFVGTLFKPEQLGLMFSIIVTPLIFTGCTFYPWSTLERFRWFQIITLINPLTYAAEGLRNAMVPVINHYQVPTLALPWTFLGLCITCVLFLILGLRMFRKRVVS